MSAHKYIRKHTVYSDMLAFKQNLSETIGIARPYMFPPNHLRPEVLVIYVENCIQSSLLISNSLLAGQLATSFQIPKLLILLTLGAVRIFPIL